MSPEQAEVQAAAAADPDEPAAPAASMASTPLDRRPLLVALAVLALLGLFGTTFFFFKYRSLSHRDHDKTAVLSVSQHFLFALTNFDANTLDADVQKLQSYATGDFQGQALKFFSPDFRQAAAKVQATSRGQINALYVESINGNTATTYAQVDQTIANLNFAKPEQDQLRIVLTLQKTGQGWKVSEVTVLQAPTTPAPGPATTAPTPTTPTTTP